MDLQEYIASLRTKKIAVLGVGVSNTPLLRLLAAGGCTVQARDKSEESELGPVGEELRALGVELITGPGYLDNIDADVIFRTPGIRPDAPGIARAVERGTVLTSEMEAFFQVCPCPIIAVTGSDGKTTTTTVISELLKAEGYRVFTGGNIGTPLLDKAGDMTAKDYAVVELSSFQLMTMHTGADIAVVTNLAPNHLDWHKDMAEYIAAKKHIYQPRGEHCRAVFNGDNAITAGLVSEAPDEYLVFSRRRCVFNGVYCQEGVIYQAVNGEDTPILRTDEIFLPGVHNVENFMAAFAALRDIVSLDTMARVAREFHGVEHRIEFVREKDGVRFYNDSIASSPSRTTAGLRSFPQKVILIAGGKDKGVPFDELGYEIVEHVKTLVLTGLTADKLRRAVENCTAYTGSPQIVTVEDFRGAVERAASLAEPGDVVLLSPACTSFDRFKNFAQRGNFFKQIVNEL